MSDYQTDRLEEIEQGHGYIHDPADIAWLISEVRRYRDEQNPNQAAKYYRTILAQRQMIKNQAATIERHDAKAASIEQMIGAWKDRASNYTAEVELAVGLFGQGIRDILRGES